MNLDVTRQKKKTKVKRLAATRESNPGHSGLSHQCVQRIVEVGGCPTVVAQWQSTGCTSQRYAWFDFQ